MSILIRIVIAGLLLCQVSMSCFASLIDSDEIMMRSTFKIQSGGMLGTCFIISEPYTNGSLTGSPVLVTAKHVLAGMTSTNATIIFRSKNDDAFSKMSFDIPIKANGTNLWTAHPTADIAVMRISNVPSSGDFSHNWFTPADLADDKFLSERQIHPGDEVRILGYSYGFEANDSGFPILRNGRIASYPLMPTAKVQTFLIDFQVFRGNSGGPVYMCERRALNDGDLTSVNVFKILGLVSEEASINEPVSTLDEQSTIRHPLGIGV